LGFFLKYKYFVLGLFAFVLYANTIKHDYTWDDQIVITQNQITQKGIQGLKEIWTEAVYIPQRPIYRPIPQTVFALEHEFFANNASVAHALQILLYVFSCLVFLCLLQAFFPTINPYLLVFIALLFTVLPVHTEVVANVKSLDELLSLLFGLLSILFARKKQKHHGLISLLFLFLALLSKVSFISLFWLPVYVLFRYNELSGFLIQNLKKHKEYFLSFALLSIAIYVYLFTSFQSLSGPIALLLALVLPIRTKTLPNFVFFCISLFFLGLLTPFFLPLLLILNWIDKQEKMLTFKSYPALLLVISSSVYFSFDSPYFWVFLIYVLFINSFKSSHKHLKFLFLFSLIILSLTLLSFYLGGKINALELIFILSPIFFYLTKKLEPRIVVLPFFIFLAFLLFKDAYKSDYARLKPMIFNESDLKIDAQAFYNEPYHNILVSADNLSEKTATICRIQLIYLQKLIFPTALVHQHGTWQIELASWKDWDVYLSILIHILLLWLAFYFYKQKYYITMWGILWYFSTISIYTNIVRLMPDTLAERFLFLPSIGFSVAFVTGIYFFIQKFQKEEKKSLITLALILAPLFSYYAYKTVERNKDWKDNYTLAANTLPYAENNAAINAQYALELNNLVKAGKIQNVDSAEALVVKHYKKAIDIFPDFYGPNADLAAYYILEAQPDSAFPYLLESTQLKPKEWLHHYYLGLIYFEKNNYQEALSYFDKIIANPTLQSRKSEFPELLEAYEFGGRCLHNTGQDNKAYAYLNMGIDLYSQKSSYILLANLYRITGKTKLAIETFERLQVLYPDDQEIINTINYLKQGLIY
jgi:tetratricopeptide (TPR) repeat protein